MQDGAINFRLVTRGGRLSDAALDFAHGDTWELVAPFFPMPSWWRRFIFRVLTPRDFTVYSYIVSYFRRAHLGTPLLRYMKEDLGIANSVHIHRSLKKLTDFAFLYKSTISVNGRKCNIYKRPSIESTLMKLLDGKHIDGNLLPIKAKRRTRVDKIAKQRTKPTRNIRESDARRSLATVTLGLEKLLGSDRLNEWKAADDNTRASVLYRLLDERLTERVRKYDDEQPFAPIETETAEELREMFDELAADSETSTTPTRALLEEGLPF